MCKRAQILSACLSLPLIAIPFSNFKIFNEMKSNLPPYKFVHALEGKEDSKNDLFCWLVI